MLSVLIPTYTEHPENLIRDLKRLLEKHPFSSEIIISDVSPEPLHIPESSADEKVLVRYFHHKKILSRSQNRNYLAEQASYPYLLFIDADAEIQDDSFIDHYVESLDEHTVVCGGTQYQSKKPDSGAGLFRWKYGLKREVKAAEKRNHNPTASFSSFNFLIPTEIFRAIRFNELFTAYGHEDTYFGYQLFVHHIHILHIDNPLIHTGLDSAETFINKTEEGIIGIGQLMQNPEIPEQFLKTIRLYRSYASLQKSGLIWMIRLLFPAIRFLSLPVFQSSVPSIALFDLYKLAFLVRIQG